MYYLPFLLGIVGYISYLIFSTQGGKKLLNFFIYILIITLLISGVAWFDYSGDGVMNRWPVSLYFIAASIFIVGVGMFSLPVETYQSIDEATILQLTIASWYGLFIYHSIIPNWLFLLAGFFTIFVLLDSFSKTPHSFFMKTFYSIWYAVMSGGFLVFAVTSDITSIAINFQDIGFLEGFTLGIVAVSSLSGLIGSGYLLFTLAIRYDNQPDYTPWPAGYLEAQIPRWLTVILIIFWVSVYFVNTSYEFFSAVTLLIFSVALIKEFSPLRVIMSNVSHSNNY